MSTRPRAPAPLSWSIAAGPLVNVALLPILLVLGLLSRSLGWAATMPNAHAWLRAVFVIDAGLLLFNILPIYPLDGGQILRSLLWYVLGRARSLQVATILGLIGVAGFIVLAIWMESVWYGAIAVFMLMNCWSGLRHAQQLLRFAKLPRRDGFTCPTCKAHPPIGDYWKCGHCAQPFDFFQTQGVCPHCSTQFALTRCLDCGTPHPVSEWFAPAMILTSTLPASTF